MELQICERDVYYINDCLLLALDQKSLAILFNLFETKYTLEKVHWLANKLETTKKYLRGLFSLFAWGQPETFFRGKYNLFTYLHKLPWRHITRFVPALRRRSLPPVFPRGEGTATRRLYNQGSCGSLSFSRSRGGWKWWLWCVWWLWWCLWEAFCELLLPNSFFTKENGSV